MYIYLKNILFLSYNIIYKYNYIKTTLHMIYLIIIIRLLSALLVLRITNIYV